MRDARHSGPDESGSTKRDTWRDIIKGLVAVRIAEAAQRVLSRRAATPEAGRLGGESGSAVAERPSAASYRETAPARRMPGGPSAVSDEREPPEVKAEKEQAASETEEVPTPRSGVLPIAK